MQPVKQVRCPRCGALSPFTAENKWRPFCSKRCKMIDLGAWASESYRVPAEEQDQPQDAADDDPTTTRRGS